MLDKSEPEHRLGFLSFKETFVAEEPAKPKRRLRTAPETVRERATKAKKPPKNPNATENRAGFWQSSHRSNPSAYYCKSSAGGSPCTSWVSSCSHATFAMHGASCAKSPGQIAGNRCD